MNMGLFGLESILVLLGVIIILFKILNNFTTRRKCIKDQVAVVTGAGNGLGAALSMEMAKLRCHVAVVDVDYENAEKVSKTLTDQGVKSKAYKVDVSDVEQIKLLKENVEKDLGVVDIIVNNAGILFSRRITDETPEKIKYVMDVNLLSLFWTTRTFLDSMIERKQGHIVSIASIFALTASPEAFTYSASKFAVRGFMESLALDLHSKGHDSYIKTSTAYPTFIKTNPNISSAFNSLVKKNNSMLPMVSVKTAVDRIIEGILLNEEVIVIPTIHYYFAYLFTIPLGLRKFANKYLLRSEANLTNVVNSLIEER